MKLENILRVIVVLILISLITHIEVPDVTPIDYKNYELIEPTMYIIESAIDSFKINTGELPGKLEDLIYCPNQLKDVWKGPYLKEKQLHDPWDNPYVYEINPNDPNSYMLISYGRDGKPGGEGYDADIFND